MDKREIYAFLDGKGIKYEVTEHKAVFNMDELAGVELPYPEADAKNLFVRDDRKKRYYLITVKGNKRVDLKEFRRANGTRPLTFASEEDLFAVLKLTPGSVTPFGLLNDDECRAEFCLDAAFLDGQGLIGCHPNDNTATVWMNVRELISLIEQHGTAVRIVAM